MKDENVIEGVIPYLGKFCMCSESAPYFDSHDQKCKTAQQVNSDGNLTFDSLFYYANEYHNYYLITNIEECSSTWLYISANKKACTSSCGAGFTGGYNLDRQTFCVCADNDYYDLKKEACVTEDACEGYTYAMDEDFL